MTQEEMKKEANDYIDMIESVVSDLDYWSVRHDDIFTGEIARIEEEIKNLRKQLVGKIIDMQH